MTLISSLHNTRVKHLRALANRKERDRAGLFLVEGVRAVAEASQGQATIELLVVAPQLLTSPYGWKLVARLRATGVPLLEVTPEVFRLFEAVGFSGGLQGLGAVVRQRWQTLPALRPARERCWVALDAVQYPGNLGTILRTSDAVGGAGIILLGQTTDPYHPAAVRASLGTIFSQRLVRASFAELVAWKERHGIPVIGTAPDAATDYRDMR
jgi:TrmH family RNA methyltransferase